MTWEVICPRCGSVSLRSCNGTRKPVCNHEYHDAKDCGICGECRTGWTPDPARLAVDACADLEAGVETEP